MALKRTTLVPVASLFCIFLACCVVFTDLAGIFNYSDIPFVLVFLLYIIVVFIQKATSRITFICAAAFLLLTGLSYVPTGPGRITERFGEWYYLFFVCGLIQYWRELWR